LQPPIILKTARHDDHDKYADHKQPRNGENSFLKKNRVEIHGTHLFLISVGCLSKPSVNSGTTISETLKIFMDACFIDLSSSPTPYFEKINTIIFVLIL
jgi:hypothetical protein